MDRDNEQEPLLGDIAAKLDGASESIVVKTAAVMLCFGVIGLNAASIGALIPFLEKHYTVRDGVVAWIFVVQMAGYLIAAANLERIHLVAGRRGVAVLTGGLHVLGFIVMATKPRFLVVLLAFFALGLGTGFADAGFCAWAAVVPNANTVQGLIHGSFSIGCVIEPLVVATLDRGGYSWNMFYIVTLGIFVLELLILLFAFRHDTGQVYQAETRSEDSEGDEVNIMDGKRPIIHCALFFLCYVGMETSVSAWLATFMSRSRGSSTFIGAITSSIFWGGMAAGRFTLGPATKAIGLRMLIVVYIFLSVLAQVAFRVRFPLGVSLALVAAVGFSFGPMFPAGVLMLISQLPSSLQVRGSAIAASVGQLGGATAPFLLGLAAESWGIERLLDLVLAMSLVLVLIWLSFCKPAYRALRRSSHRSLDLLVRFLDS